MLQFAFAFAEQSQLAKATENQQSTEQIEDFDGDENRIDEKKEETAEPKIVETSTATQKKAKLRSLTTTNTTGEIVNFRTKSGTTSYKDAITGISGYTHGQYGADAAYIGMENGKVKFMLAGVVGLVDSSDVQVLSLSQVKSKSYYQVSGGNLYHKICTDMTTSGTYYSINNGTAPDCLKTNTTYYSYDGHYFYTNYNTMLTDYRNESRKNSVNSTEPFFNYYQYLPLRSQTNYTGTQLNTLINSKVGTSSKMYNTGNTLVTMQDTYGVNALLMTGVAANESAWGKSNIALTKNNLFGLNAVDSSPGQSANYYSDVSTCIQDFAETYMSKRYLRPGYTYHKGGFLGNKASGINVSYASDPYWGEKAAQYAYMLDANGGNRDYGKYTLGIKDCMPYGDTVLNVRKEASTSSTVLYKTPAQSQYAFILLNGGQENNGFYKVQSEPVLNTSRSAIVTTTGKYNFTGMYLYASSDYISIVNTGLKLTAENVGHTKIKLTWNKVSGVDGYAIYRKEGSTGDYEKIKALGVSTTEYTDTNCDISTQYTYKIMTYTRNSSGTYSYSPAEYLTVTTKGKEPSGVENVRVYNVTTNSIWLGWDSDWEGYTGGYVVYRADSANGEYKKIETVPNGKVSFADYDVKDGQTYYYKVMAYKNVSGKYYYSDYSEVYEYTVKLKPIEIITPGKTTNAKVYKQTAKSLWIGWDKAANADGYYVYRRTGTSGSFSKVATVTGGSQAWADYNIKNNTTYYYYIEAYKDNSGTVKCGAASNICSKKTNLNPVKPTGFVAYKYTSNSVWLGWNKSDKADGYVVYKRNGTSGNFSKVKTVTGGSQAWADYDIKKGKKYQYYVQAYNGVNGAYYYSPASSVITVTAK